MNVCPVCGFRNMDSNDRCFRCSALLRRSETIEKEAFKSAGRREWKDAPRRLLYSPIDWLRHRPWVGKLWALPEHGEFRYPYTAGLLSVVPGGGHLYIGQRPKAALFFAVAIAIAALAAFTFTHPISDYVLFGALAYWLWVISDAIGTAAQMTGSTWRVRKTLALMCAGALMLGLTLTALQWFGVNFLTFQKISTPSMQPAIHEGDRLMTSDIPLWFRNPRVGEVVQYDPPRFVATAGETIYSINISKYFQRVIGEPGDHMVKKTGVIYRNDKPLPPDQQPFLGNTLPDFDLTVPEEHYCLPVTGIPADALASLFGAPDIGVVGQQGFGWPDWPKYIMVPQDQVSALGLAIASPPEHRRWLK